MVAKNFQNLILKRYHPEALLKKISSITIYLSLENDLHRIFIEIKTMNEKKKFGNTLIYTYLPFFFLDTSVAISK